MRRNTKGEKRLRFRDEIDFDGQDARDRRRFRIRIVREINERIANVP